MAQNLLLLKELIECQPLGITTKRTPNAFTEALLELDNNYDSYKKVVEGFKKNLNWTKVARNHRAI